METTEVGLIIKDVHEIKNTLTKFDVRLQLVYNSLVGNEISRDGGLVGDILNQAAEIKALEKRVEAIEKAETKRRFYVNIIWGTTSAIITMILTILLTKAFH